MGLFLETGLMSSLSRAENLRDATRRVNGKSPTQVALPWFWEHEYGVPTQRYLSIQIAVQLDEDFVRGIPSKGCWDMAFDWTRMNSWCNIARYCVYICLYLSYFQGHQRRH